MSRLMLPVERHKHAQACQPCEGAGVTGERLELAIYAGDHVLVLEVICPACGGCGNGDPQHPGCKAEWHAYREDGGDDWGAEEGGGDDELLCYSCGSGRGWNVVQGFCGEGDDMEMVLTRVPCGCSESRLVEAGDG